jgi:hypothetical protein
MESLVNDLFVVYVLSCLICKIECVCIAGSPTRQSGRLFQFIPTLQLSARHCTGRNRDRRGVWTVFAVSVVLLSSLFCLYLASLVTLACFGSLFFFNANGQGNFIALLSDRTRATFSRICGSYRQHSDVSSGNFPSIEDFLEASRELFCG